MYKVLQRFVVSNQSLQGLPRFCPGWLSCPIALIRYFDRNIAFIASLGEKLYEKGHDLIWALIRRGTNKCRSNHT